MKKNILICCDYYLPGFRAGGPVRSIEAIVAALKDHANITIVTRNHDCGVKIPYDNITSNELLQCDGYRILYLSDGKIISGMKHLLASELFDMIYCNSLFSPYFSTLPIILNQFIFRQKIKVMIAPRGELGVGALSLKKRKKKCFLFFARFLLRAKNIFWHSTSVEEQNDIKEIIGKPERIVLLPNMVSRSLENAITHCKHQNTLRIVFISRISKKKNLDFALSVLSSVRGNVVFDIYGPIEDLAYWEWCQSIIKNLPGNVVVHYCDAIEHERVAAVLAQYDLFFLPTLNENYGHAIVEAFSLGCPVLISTNTPWKNLSEQNAGWDMSLENPSAFSNKIDELILLSEESYRVYQKGAISYFDNYVNNPRLGEEYRDYFLNT